ncbi:hypothetical protein ACFY0A_28280 [Streptomyces sp. NPDC001698]|uniref:hypothetical protein n=1 Tax=unclassified Streptomyces TaxID=2593676 RepID=UPI0036936EAE
MRHAHKPLRDPAEPSGPGRRTVFAALAGAGAAVALGTGAATASAASPGAASGGTLFVKAFPDAETERLRLDRSLRAGDFIPTGRYAAPSTPLTVRVRSAHGVFPVLHIGTFGLR